MQCGLRMYIISVPLTFLLAITNWCEGKYMFWVVSIRFFPGAFDHKNEDRKMEGLWNWESLNGKTLEWRFLNCPKCYPSAVWVFSKSFDSMSYDSIPSINPLFTSVTKVSNCYLKRSKLTKSFILEKHSPFVSIGQMVIFPPKPVRISLNMV